jgi:hypothetical protein
MFAFPKRIDEEKRQMNKASGIKAKACLQSDGGRVEQAPAPQGLGYRTGWF